MQAVHKFLAKHTKKGQKKPKHSDTTNLWFTLSREIRDQIYREVLCKRYLIHRPARWKRGKTLRNENRPLREYAISVRFWTGIYWRGHAWMLKKPTSWANVALLLASKAICWEAIEMMYKESSFCVYMGEKSVWWHRLTPLPSQQLLSRIQNLEVDTCVCDTLDYTASETWFQKFNGSDTKRNSCRISFPCYSCLVWCEDHTPFFRACQSLVGFKTVTITLEQRYMDADGSGVLIERYNSIREDFQTALEPHLGPGRPYDIGYVYCLDFYPRKHLEDLLAAPPKSGPQVLGLRED